MFTPHMGVINALLTKIGLPRINWFGTNLSLYSVMIADFWEWTPLPLVIVYAGRAAIPERIFEAARIDGIPTWRITGFITLPLLRNLIILAFLLRVMDSYKFFDTLFIMTYGGPGTASELPGFLIFQLGLRDFDTGRAAALTWVVGMGAVVIMQLIWTYLKKEKA
jgi:multiple sugar transport system permease protein